MVAFCQLCSKEIDDDDDDDDDVNRAVARAQKILALFEIDLL